jgi:hypothetical protein
VRVRIETRPAHMWHSPSTVLRGFYLNQGTHCRQQIVMLGSSRCSLHHVHNKKLGRQEIDSEESSRNAHCFCIYEPSRSKMHCIVGRRLHSRGLGAGSQRRHAPPHCYPSSESAKCAQKKFKKAMFSLQPSSNRFHMSGSLHLPTMSSTSSVLVKLG